MPATTNGRLTPELWERAKTIIADALEIENNDEREAFVAQQCRGDASLRSEVDSLLDQTTTGFDESLLQAKTGLRTDAYLSAGRRIGRYEVIKELGRGGMGAVYLGRRADGEFDKLVAIKLLKRGTDTDEILRRFSSERQILARLEHPNIARLLDAGTSDDGLPYFAMEYVEGVPITAYARERHLPLKERLTLFRTICSAVSYAHRNLVIHRDLKPGNVIVTGAGDVKLLDFGIAKLLQDTGEPAVTMASAPLMTPEYASPEQISGAPVTTASDVYSLGVLLYELLTGARPHQLTTRHLQTAATNDPQRPSTALRQQGRAVEVNDKLLRGDLDNIILKALRKEPERRYSSVDEFSADIRRHLEGLPVRARPDTIGYRAGKFIGRHKTSVAASVMVFLALIVGTVIAVWQAHRAHVAAARAETRFNQVRRLAHSVLFNYHDEIAALPGSTRVREQLIKDALEYLDNLSQEAGRDAGLLRELATAYEKVGQVQGNSYYSNLGETAGALRSYERSLAIRKDLVTRSPRSLPLHDELANSYEGLGDMLYTVGDLSGGLTQYEQARELREEVINKEPANVSYRLALAELYTKLGDIKGMEGYANLGDTTGALEAYLKAEGMLTPLASAEPNSRSRQSKLGEVLSHVGMLYDVTGDVPSALTAGRKAVAMIQTLVTSDQNNQHLQSLLLAAKAFLRYALVDANLLDEAITQSRGMIADLETMAARDQKNSYLRRALGVTYNSLGSDLLMRGDISGALDSHEKALEISRTNLETDPSSDEKKADVAYSLRRLGEAQAAAGNQNDALRSFREALELRHSAANSQNVRSREEIALLDEDMARALAAIGANEDANGTIQPAVTSFEELAQQSPRNAKYRAELANAYFTQADLTKTSDGNCEKALPLFKQSFETWKELQTSGRLPPVNAARPEEVMRRIEQCESASHSAPL